MEAVQTKVAYASHSLYFLYVAMWWNGNKKYTVSGAVDSEAYGWIGSGPDPAISRFPASFDEPSDSSLIAGLGEL